MCTGVEPLIAEGLFGGELFAGDALLGGADLFGGDALFGDAITSGLGSDAFGGVAGDAFLPGSLGADGLGGLGSGLESSFSGLGDFGGAVGDGGIAESGGFGSGFDPTSTSNLNTAFNDPGTFGATDSASGFNTPDAYDLQGSNSLTSPTSGNGFSTPDQYSAAKDSQAYNASQPYGNRGLEGMYDSAKGTYNDVMNYSPFGDGGPTIGNAKSGMNVISGLSSLYDMNAKNQIGKQQLAFNQNAMDRVNNYGALGSPERAAMQQTLDRQDAKAGRNSQYGQRAVDLEAKLASNRANYSAQTLGTGFNNQTAGLNNRYGGLNSLFYNAGRR